MPCKIYGHVDVDGQPQFCLPVEVPRPEDAQFGSVKQTLLTQFKAAYPDEATLDYNECCFWNQDRCPIPDRAPISVFAWEHNDFFLRRLPEGVDASALASSHQKAGELSYYYAHNRSKQSLVSRPPASTSLAAAPREPLKVKQMPAAGSSRFNAKQSPFGTDIQQYETLTTYTWEDHDGDTVKVLVPLEGVGRLPPSQVKTQFGVRQFELLIEGYNGKNLRFACYKTHGEMDAAQCKHIVRANRVNLIIKKSKEKDIWFDLFKKRAIGDDDDP